MGIDLHQFLPRRHIFGRRHGIRSMLPRQLLLLLLLLLLGVRRMGSGRLLLLLMLLLLGRSHRSSLRSPVRIDQGLHRWILLLLLLLLLLLRQGGGGGESVGNEVLQRDYVLLLLLVRHLSPILKFHHLLNDLPNVLLKRGRRELGPGWISRDHLLALRRRDRCLL